MGKEIKAGVYLRISTKDQSREEFSLSEQNHT